MLPALFEPNSDSPHIVRNCIIYSEHDDGDLEGCARTMLSDGGKDLFFQQCKPGCEMDW